MWGCLVLSDQHNRSLPENSISQVPDGAGKKGTKQNRKK
jgi:hypothetical protein